MPAYDIEYEQDDGTQVYELDTKDGQSKDIDYNSHSDSEEKNQKHSSYKVTYEEGPDTIAKAEDRLFGRSCPREGGIKCSLLEESKAEVNDKLWEEIIRYFEVDETGKQFVMNRLGILLRNSIRKLYTTYIKPHLGNSKKRGEIHVRYRAIITKKDDWNKFMTYTHSE
ncbi:unnamed protein product [Lactuca saligna]|uniref:Uncharacterized protein n=1 Tax=Lactuca saligna TaxID=75948 RepID=A0AA35YER2_LACSI|nr:unnamed protein product [Lactuca saligna]